MSDNPDRCIVVGVSPRQPDRVVREAARYARKFGAVLVCANVDPTSYVVEEKPDGSVTSRPIDPDLPQWGASAFDDKLAARIEALALEEQVQVLFRELAGDIARALGRLAEVLEAEMIVVGSRRSGFRSGLHEFFGGSVAANLAHRQPRPVVVIPLTPVPPGSRLPWEETGP